ncbi:polyribonucleotide nucleotidyltransferase 1, mitochondrial-like [Argonauta hians]
MAVRVMPTRVSIRRLFSHRQHVLAAVSTLRDIINRQCCRCASNTSATAWQKRSAPGEIDVDIGTRKLKITTGKLARFADGAAVAEFGGTAVLVTAVCSDKVSSSGFMPLTVDFRQKAAAAGRIPTNHLRREIGMTQEEILTSRMIDRSLRPLFPEGFCNETQLMCNLLSVDGDNNPDVLCINAASVALSLSSIPWNGPVGAVRVGLVNDGIVINPTRRQISESSLNLIVACIDQYKVVMLESSSSNILQQDLMRAIKQGVKESQLIIQAIKQLQKQHGRHKRDFNPPFSTLDADIKEAIKSMSSLRIKDILQDSSHDKVSRDEAISTIRTDVLEKVKETYPLAEHSSLLQYFGAVFKEIFRNQIFDTDKRCDGRSVTDVRDIHCQVDMFKPLHGSSLFQRGQTQVFCTVAFDSLESALKSEPYSDIRDKNFMLHYEFPPYATNETGRLSTIGRREIGHGDLAQKGLQAIIPDDYPFTIRLTSEVLESNGSSSMASVCGGSLALMDAGVPVKEAVAGVAMGLITKKDESKQQDVIEDYKILTDILGIEDYLGDMDFKLAGTRRGITALQADIKVSGLPLQIVNETVQQALIARQHILNIMDSTLPRARDNGKDNKPVTEKLEVPIADRNKLLGIGGYNLKKIRRTTGVTVSPVDETTFQVFAPNQSAFHEAQEMIDDYLKEERLPELEFGAIYNTKIVEVRENGLMLQFNPKMQPAFLHISQLDQRKVNHPSALGMEVGQEVAVKYFGRDPATGQIRLSRKVLFSPATSVIRNIGSKQ